MHKSSHYWRSSCFVLFCFSSLVLNYMYLIGWNIIFFVWEFAILPFKGSCDEKWYCGKHSPVTSSTCPWQLPSMLLISNFEQSLKHSFQPQVLWTLYEQTRLVYHFMFVLKQLQCPGNGSRKKKLRNHQGRAAFAKTSGQLWACWTQSIRSPVPWTHKVLLLDNTKTFQPMYCIFHKMLVIYL